MAVILNALGEPEIPDAIRRRVAALGGGFSLALRSGCWWLMQRWREGDPRWAYVQNGTIHESEAADGLGAFPMDMGFDQMPAFIERSLRQYPASDLSRVADAFAKGETQAPEADKLKHEVFEDVIKAAESEGRVTGTRVVHKKTK